jgi:tetratricopeptide (TPR) repeat protein/tRNA A-37 threonylcarbamoyl transferase component Bud32
MTPERWQRLKPLLDAALHLGEAERRAYVESVGCDDSGLRHDLMMLLLDNQTAALPAGTVSPPMKANPFANGQLLLGRFRIVRMIGRGGMGEVYEAEDLELGRVALKTIRASLGGDQELLRRFKQEIQLARRVSHPNVCKIYELFTMPGIAGQPATAFLTMEFLEGETLADKLRNGPLPWPDAQRVALDLCAGLGAIHETGIIHRDLKMRNIMLVERQGQTSAVLTDFGLALRLDDGGRVKHGDDTHLLAGTPEYMAPEQFEGKELTRAADIYSLGVVLFEMVSGQRLYGAHTPMAAAIGRARKPQLPHAPHGWREIIFRCLEFEPEDRYASAAQVATALRHAANPVWRTVHNTALFAKRFRLGVALLACAVLVTAGLWVRRQLRLHVPPPDAVHWYNLGVDALREGTYVKAIRELEPATQRDKQFAMAHARLAEAWGELDFTGKAEHEMLVANATAPDDKLTNVDSKYLAATQATLTGDYSGAEQSYKDILDNLGDADKPVGYVDLGRAQEKAGKPLLAMASYKKAAAMAPDLPAPFVHIGILESHMQHESNAQAAFSNAETLYKAESNVEGLAEIEFERGYLADEQGRSAEAMQHLQQALALARNIPSVQLEIRTLTQMSTAVLDTSNQQAIDYATQAIELAHNNALESWAANGLIARANAYLNTPAKFGLAETDLQQALQIAQQGGQYRWEARAELTLASLRDSEQRPEEVIPLAQKALDYYRTHGFNSMALDAGILLGRSQENTDQLDAALASSKDLVQASEKSGSKRELTLALELEGEVLLRQENCPAALAALQSGLNNASDDYRPYLADQAAQALACLGRYDQAQIMLRPYLQSGPLYAPKLTQAHIFISQQDYKHALSLSQQEMTDPDAKPAVFDFTVIYAVAEAKIGHPDKALTDIATAKPDSAQDRAAWHFAKAEIEIASGKYAEGRNDAEAAMDYYMHMKLPVSQALTASLLLQTSREGDKLVNSQILVQSTLDSLRQLEALWTAPQYASFVSRPDIQEALKHLQ